MIKQYYYTYLPDTKEYVYKSLLEEDPLVKDRFPIPSYSTLIKPLSKKEGYTICFNESKNKWEYIVDNRDKVYYKNKKKVNFNLGDEIDDTMSEKMFTEQEEKLQEKNNKINNYVINRKNKQIENLVIDKNITIYATDKARDNLFRAYIIMKHTGKKDKVWLDVNNNEFMLSFKKLKEILIKLDERDSKLYLDESKYIKSLDKEYK